MNNFTNYVNSIVPLEPEAQANFTSKLTVAEYKKGEILVPDQSVCRNLFFLKQGLVKFYFISDEGKEVIFRFFSEHSVFTSLESFLTERPTTHILVSLEPAFVEFISKKDLEELCCRYHSVEKFYRYVLSLAATNMIRRFSELMTDASTGRYNNFVQENNSLLQRISLGDVANYLGITQVSLSRIRAAK